MGARGTFKEGGIPIKTDTPIYGRTFYVGNATIAGQDAATDDPGYGDKPTRPFATINYAVSQCVASRGDIIEVMPGHVEDLADTSSTGAIDLDVVGITLRGHGHGTLQPRIDFNHADSDFIVGANNITIENINFEATVTVVKIGVAIEAAVTNTTIKDCKFSVETTGTDEFLIAVNLLAGCNFTKIQNCHIDMGLGGAAHGIKLVGASTDVDIHDCVIKGDYSVACIGGITTLSTEVDIARNLLVQGGTGNLNAVAVIVMLTGTTGYVRGNTIVCDVATFALQTVADTMTFIANERTDDISQAKTSAQTSASVTVSADA